MVERIPYDEFSMFADNAKEYGIPFKPPAVRRQAVTMADGRCISALIWGKEPPEAVFLHGGAQNAHTWDTVLLALDRPAVAIDLPGHGHSDGGRAGYVDPRAHAEDVAVAVEALAPGARVLVGMSLGGLTSIALAAAHPELVARLVLVDITPGVTAEKSAAIAAFVSGPESFPDFDAILARTVEHNPTRTVSSLRRGILHNALQREDGTWVWRYARHRSGEPEFTPLRATPDFGSLWDDLGSLRMPVMLVRGMRPQSVVDDADEAELRRRLPGAKVAHIDAGHSVQGDDPVGLASLIAEFSQ